MCGIAGILKFNGERVDSISLKQMCDTMHHRGPDGEGQWYSDSGNLGLGHRRLSILDLSDKGSQPMEDSESRYIITFNGEIYNYLELRDELAKRGEQFTSGTDTEVLLSLYKVYGKQCLAKLDGMFAFAIWDKKTEELFCARDRFGEKPFYYYKDERQFVFASEIKALWAAGIEKKPQQKMIYDYLVFNSIQDSQNINTSFFQNIYSLEQAHSMLISSNGCIEPENYWNLDDIELNNQISFEDAQTEFYRLFSDSINKRLRSDVPVGSSLSGGLDSSSIVSLINRGKNPEQTQKTFSARFKDFDKDESFYIDKLLSRLSGVDAYSVFPSEETIDHNIGELIQQHDQPFRSLSIAVQFEVMKLAKENGVTVLLDGQGADEYLAGYDSFYYSYYNQLRIQDKKTYKKEIQDFEKLKGRTFDQSSFKELLKGRNTFIFEQLASFRRNSLSNTHAYFRGIHPDLVAEFKHSKNPIYKPTNLKEHIKTSVLNKGLSELLRYADANSMANSVEVRLPFLSHKLVEFTFSLPDEYLINRAWNKYILRRSMEPYVPEEIIWRKEKIGYETPQDKWLKNSKLNGMIEAAKERLLDEKILIQVKPGMDWNYLMLASYL